MTTATKRDPATTVYRENLTGFINQFSYLTVARAVNYLKYIFDADEAVVMVGQHCVTPAELAMVEKFRGVSADQLRLSFWGGPPTAQGWFEGTLLSVLIERFLVALSTRDTDKVDRFIASCTD